MDGSRSKIDMTSEVGDGPRELGKKSALVMPHRNIICISMNVWYTH